MRIDDPWHDDLASGPEDDGEPPVPVPAARRRRRGCRNDPPGRSRVSCTVCPTARQRYVLPGTVAFLGWYLAYAVAAATAPGLLVRPVAGVLNVAMAAGLAQFGGTFLLTRAYLGHVRRRPDGAAFELRWETRDMARGTAGEASAVREPAR